MLDGDCASGSSCPSRMDRLAAGSSIRDTVGSGGGGLSTGGRAEGLADSLLRDRGRSGLGEPPVYTLSSLSLSPGI